MQDTSDKLTVPCAHFPAEGTKLSFQPCFGGPKNTTTAFKGDANSIWRGWEGSCAIPQKFRWPSMSLPAAHPAQPTHAPFCVLIQEGGKMRKKIRSDQKQRESSKANVFYYSTGSFRAFDVASPTQSCFFHSLFLHMNKMLHVLYTAHPQLLFKAYLSQLTVLCNIFQTRTHAS